MYILYTLEHCPYCHRVIDAAKEMGIELKIKDRGQAENMAELIELGGIKQVPYLYDVEEGKGMYESEDIIGYLKENQ